VAQNVSEETRRVVFALHIPALASLGVATVADVVIRYASVGDEVALHETTVPAAVNLVSSDEAAAATPDNEVTEEIVVLKAARAQEEARVKADQGDFDGARKVLSDASDELRKRAPNSPRAEELLTHADELAQRADFMAPAAYDAASRKAMLYSTRDMRRKRRRE